MNYNKLNCIWRGSEKKSLYTEKKKIIQYLAYYPITLIILNNLYIIIFNITYNVKF